MGGPQNYAVAVRTGNCGTQQLLSADTGADNSATTRCPNDGTAVCACADVGDASRACSDQRLCATRACSDQRVGAASRACSNQLVGAASRACCLGGFVGVAMEQHTHKPYVVSEIWR